MENLSFLTLKTPDGRAIGYARASGGTVELRGAPKGSLAVFTSEGVFCTEEKRIPVTGTVEAVVLHEDGYLVALARPTPPKLGEEHIRRTLMAMRRPHAEEKPPAPVLEVCTVEPEPAVAVAEPAAKVCTVEPEPAVAVAEPAAKVCAVTAEAVADEPESIDESAAESESFMALLRRADRAFAIAMERKPPDPVYAPIAHNESVGTPFLQSRDTWEEEVERLLAELPATELREPIANPFPNIFPSARFLRMRRDGGIEHLSGEWVDPKTGEKVHITAVHGAYSPRPPKALPDFTRYIRSRSGGYWVKTERAAED